MKNNMSRDVSFLLCYYINVYITYIYICFNLIGNTHIINIFFINNNNKIIILLYVIIIYRQNKKIEELVEKN